MAAGKTKKKETATNSAAETPAGSRPDTPPEPSSTPQQTSSQTSDRPAGVSATEVETDPRKFVYSNEHIDIGLSAEQIIVHRYQDDTTLIGPPILIRNAYDIAEALVASAHMQGYLKKVVMDALRRGERFAYRGASGNLRGTYRLCTDKDVDELAADGRLRYATTTSSQLIGSGNVGMDDRGHRRAMRGNNHPGRGPRIVTYTMAKVEDDDAVVAALQGQVKTVLMILRDHMGDKLETGCVSADEIKIALERRRPELKTKPERDLMSLFSFCYNHDFKLSGLMTRHERKNEGEPHQLRRRIRRWKSDSTNLRLHLLVDGPRRGLRWSVVGAERDLELQGGRMSLQQQIRDLRQEAIEHRQAALKCERSVEALERCLEISQKIEKGEDVPETLRLTGVPAPAGAAASTKRKSNVSYEDLENFIVEHMTSEHRPSDYLVSTAAMLVLCRDNFTEPTMDPTRVREILKKNFEVVLGPNLNSTRYRIYRSVHA